jgi:hypothetical protein
LRSAANVNDADWLADAGNGRLLGLWHGIFHTFFIDATNAGLSAKTSAICFAATAGM